MSDEYRPEISVILNAKDNRYYFTDADNGAVSAAPGVFTLSPENAAVTAEYEYCGASGAVRQRTSIKNTGNEPLSVELLSSVFVSGIGKDGSKPWKKHRFILHYADTCWQGEAQWKHVYAEDAGLYRTYNHNTQSSFRLNSQSSWSTCWYEPVLIIEDTELNKSTYIQIDCGHGWCIDAGVRGYRDDLQITVLATDCFERCDGWHKELAPGETVSTCYSVTGTVDGGFEEAAASLTEARRAYFKAGFENGVPPLCYNDYMNALWALPTREKTLPLVKKAAELGCEYYVMDAGWYSYTGDEEADLGMWEINDRLFGEKGLQGIFDDVINAGMKPGIWLEIESVGINAKIVKEHPEYLLYRHGHPVGGRRALFDFRVEGVREHIRSRIKLLYGMGVRFIKNDYNNNTGVGVDPDGALSIHEHTAAFYDFIDGIRREFPDLIIENCGSGAMRSDAETLSHFHLQSVSDQEDYFRLPSIVSGSCACMPPERCGVWAYPYPVKIDHRTSFRPSPEFTDLFKDGRVTSYCMVSGLMGLSYLSGRIDCADGLNTKLMKKAAELYKKTRGHIARSVPVYPTGTFYIDTDGCDSFGLNDKEDRTLMLAVWNNSDKEVKKQIPIEKYAGKTAELSEVFPPLDEYSASLDGSTVTVSLPAGKTALYALIKY